MENIMEENKNLNFETEEPWIITLTDEETGEDQDFEVIAQGTVAQSHGGVASQTSWRCRQ